MNMNNLLGGINFRNDDIPNSVIAKAEHLRCLLLNWMIRLDHDTTNNSERYFFDSANNLGMGMAI